MEVMHGLNKEGLREINKLKDKRESIFIKKSSKSERRYQLVVRLNAIKYKEDFLCYLSSYFYCQASPQAFISSLLQDVIFFDCLLYKSFIIFFVTSFVLWLLWWLCTIKPYWPSN